MAPPYRPVNPLDQGRVNVSPPIHGTPSRNNQTIGQIITAPAHVLVKGLEASAPQPQARDSAAALARVPKPRNTVKLAPKVAPPKASPRPARPAQLPSTSGKTTVPARQVTPSPAPAPKAKTAPRAPSRRAAAPKAVVRQQDAAAATAPALTPDQQAAQAVNAALAPLYAAQTTQANGQNTAIANLTQAIIAQLLPGAAQVGGQYDQSIGQQTNLSNSAADALRAANPNTQDQALLAAINAPDAQRAQLAGQNNAAFNGGAAVGSYVGGVLPMSSLQSEKLAAMGLAQQQPAIEGLRGQQALSAALTNQSAERAKIDAMRPDLVQKYQAANVAAAQKQAYLDIARQSLGLKAQGQSFSQGLAATKLSVQQKQFIARQQQQAAIFNARQTNEQTKRALPNASLSSKVGYLVDSTGSPVNGKITPLPGYRVISGRVVKQGSKGKAQRLSAYQVQKYKGEAATIAANGKTGFDGKDPVTGKPKHFPPLTLAEAWTEMMKHGIPETVAMAALRRAYPGSNPGMNPAINPNAAGPPAP